VSSGGSGSGGSGGGGSSGGIASGSSSGASSSSGGGTTSGSSGGGSSSGSTHDGGSPGINWGYSVPSSDLGTPVTLTATTFQVAPGAEVFKCQVFANPFSGVNTDIVKMEGTMSTGSHHFFLFNLSAAEAAVEPAVGTLGNCTGNGLEFHPFPYLSQQPVWNVAFPQAADGSPMGYPIVGGNSLMINVHYLNTGTTTINATATIKLYPAKPGVVTTHVGSIFLNQTGMSIPPTPMTSPIISSATWIGDGTLPANYNIITSWQHMHYTSLKFNAMTNGTSFYTDTNWDSPNLYFHAPGMTEPTTATGPKQSVPMTNSQSITWECTYYNPTSATLTFGDFAQKSVMCIYIGQYYPANASAPDIVYVGGVATNH
jgi:hypothetical protein